MKDRRRSASPKDAPRERGVLRKNWRETRYHVVLVYPNTYDVGMGNLGFQTVYGLFNRMPEWLCERAFLPVRPDGSLESIESGRPLTDFDVVAFSISFENDFVHVPALLRQAGVPVWAHQRRSGSFPLILAGGVACTLNPEPIAPFIDVFLLGEAEEVLDRWAVVYDQTEGWSIEERLWHMARSIPCAYVPEFYDIGYADAGGILFRKAVQPDLPQTIQAGVLQDVDLWPTSTRILTDVGAFRNHFLIEIGRGCPHGCRFCSAGFLYRPPRYRSLAVLIEELRRGADLSSIIGILGTAVSDLPFLPSVCAEGRKAGVSLSFSSLRVDAITPELAEELAAQGVKTATLAPEAGSERMRRVINKGIDETQVIQAVRSLVRAGIPNLKLYFMMGLPTETMDDIEAIVALIATVKAVFLEESRKRGTIGTIAVSLNAFVPKPVTPFQWAPMNPAALLRQKARIIRNDVGRIPNVTLSVEPIRDAVLQGWLSRTDRRAAEALDRASRSPGGWKGVLRSMPMDPEEETTRQRPFSETLPWDFIDTGVSRTFLQGEYERALEGRPSPPCPLTACTRCGACRQHRQETP